LEHRDEDELGRRQFGHDHELDGGGKPPAASERGANESPPQVRGGQRGVHSQVPSRDGAKIN
jgi:hypothetical protein